MRLAAVAAMVTGSRPPGFLEQLHDPTQVARLRLDNFEAATRRRHRHRCQRTCGQNPILPAKLILLAPAKI